MTEITDKITDGTHHSPTSYPKGDYMYITAKNIKDSGVALDNMTFVTSEVFQEVFSRCNPEKGDILYVKDGATTGVVTINDIDDPFCLLSSVALIKPSKSINSRYLLYYLKSSICYSSVRESMKGVGITRITLKQIESWNIPIPPLSEQKRIVDEVERWFTKIDAIEQSKCDLNSVVQKTKNKILDLALSGKLTSDTSHYPQLPDGWEYKQLDEVLDYEQPQKYIVDSTDYSDDYTMPVLTAGKSFIIGHTNERTGICTDVPVIIFDDFTTDSKFVNFPFKVKSSAMKILHPKVDINLKYIAYFMSTTRLVGTTHKRYWISEYSKIKIPIPPKEEQDKIVFLIEKFYSLMDSIFVDQL